MAHGLRPLLHRTANANADAYAAAAADASADAYAIAFANASAVANAHADADAFADATAFADAYAYAIAIAYPKGPPMRISLTIDLHSFLAHPYRREMNALINITKESGMNRARSTANARKALEEHLRSIGMTLAEFDALKGQANDPWTVDAEGRIVIPRLNVTSMCVAMCDEARAAQKPCPPAMVRTALRPSAWSTDAEPTDAHVWERFAVVTAGTGAKLSNQRGFRSNEFIGADPPEGGPTKAVTAIGTFDINPDMVRPEILASALSWAGDRIGIGASRKMGFGRFTVVAFDIENEGLE